MASGVATSVGRPNIDSTAKTTMPVSSDSATLVASSHGLRTSHFSRSRAPASNSSSASAPSMTTRSAGSSPPAPRPVSASMVPTIT